MEWVIVDLETTGLHPNEDHIIEIGAVRINEKGERQIFQTLIDPCVTLSRRIVEITGISDEMLNGQPFIEEIMDDFISFIGDATLIAHNASFDGAFLEPFLGIFKEEWLDTVTLAKMAFPMLESYSLPNLISYFNIECTTHHRALADALSTADLFMLMEESFRTVDKGIIAAWLHLIGDHYPVYRRYFQRFDPDVFAETYLPPKSTPINRSEKDSEDEESPEKYIIDKDEILSCFQSENGLKKYISGYRCRESQTKMSLAVCEAFNQDSFLLAEAGTGTGKTIAYLLPSVFLSLYGKQPVIISTHTIHLQDQIMRKDIPELNNYFQGQIRSALIKGRSHYLCYRKWEYLYDNFEKSDAMFMSRLLPWVCETTDGDVDIVNLNGREKREWQKLSAASENCLGIRCPYYHSRCFVRRARREAEKANLIVINHSLLLTDSVMSGGILPESGYLIIDEAHQLENVAESSLGKTFSFYDHNTAVNELLSVLQKLYQRISLPGLYVTEDALEKLNEKQTFLEELMDNLRVNREKAQDGFMSLKDFMDFYSSYRSNAVRTVRIDEKTRNFVEWYDTQTKLENLLVWYEEIRTLLNKTSAAFEAEIDSDGYENDKIRFSVAKGNWTKNCTALSDFLKGEDNGIVSWLEIGNERTLMPIIKTSPLTVDEAMSEVLYRHKNSIVFVSATLSVNGHFQYYRDSCGIDLAEKDVSELLLPSPFDYEHQAVLLAATDVPLVGTLSEYEYIERISAAIYSLTKASKGRALVLFTSHVHLREVFHRIEKPLMEHGITALAHEISGNRSTILKRMREDSHTVILGANSFWEGIDVAGENLSLLIIVRLPFWPPDIPTIAAKTDRLKKENRNSFGELSLPQAIIRFKQGFGRLLRKEDDRGIICVLDKRIYEKRYGADFVASLPVSKLYRGTIKEISKLIDTRL